ncbi:hypothetical protein D3C72_1201740 [compost metagenome]
MPLVASIARSGSRWSGWILMMKRLGASAGVALRQESTRSLRVMPSSSSAISPTASATVWSTVTPRRRSSTASAKRQPTLPRARPRMPRESASSSPRASTAKATPAPTNPPAVVRPSFRSRAATISNATKAPRPSA